MSSDRLPHRFWPQVNRGVTDQLEGHAGVHVISAGNSSRLKANRVADRITSDSNNNNNNTNNNRCLLKLVVGYYWIFLKIL